MHTCQINGQKAVICTVLFLITVHFPMLAVTMVMWPHTKLAIILGLIIHFIIIVQLVMME